MRAPKDPSWWNEELSLAWERSKAALRRDWARTKTDFGAGADELDQTLDSSLEPAPDWQALPPANGPAPAPLDDDAWTDAEPAVRYGHGARSQHEDGSWNEALEAKLRKEWTTTLTDTPWERVKHAVRRGWDSAKHGAPVARR